MDLNCKLNVFNSACFATIDIYFNKMESLSSNTCMPLYEVEEYEIIYMYTS